MDTTLTDNVRVDGDPGAWAPEACATGRSPDVNSDGVVDAVDIQIVVNAAVGLDVPYPIDITGDDVADSSDVQAVVNAAMGEWECC